MLTKLEKFSIGEDLVRGGTHECKVVLCGWTLGSAGIQKLKARVLLDAGEGVIGNALEQIDLETWSFSIKQLLFSSSQILLICS